MKVKREWDDLITFWAELSAQSVATIWSYSHNFGLISYKKWLLCLTYQKRKCVTAQYITGRVTPKRAISNKTGTASRWKIFYGSTFGLGGHPLDCTAGSSEETVVLPLLEPLLFPTVPRILASCIKPWPSCSLMKFDKHGRKVRWWLPLWFDCRSTACHTSQKINEVTVM